ncbi:4909_t:CDS:2 [Entrophospora sp. SA101]|nr:4909_t:CDS:2 [Entrophospora sp. SA101]CAJ0905736.1 15675_t:CDS:2 [Entrophospora sp. SA101]
MWIQSGTNTINKMQIYPSSRKIDEQQDKLNVGGEFDVGSEPDVDNEPGIVSVHGGVKKNYY